ncbi:MAG: chromosome partitioning protein ParB, partial [Firmicutes bacterium]|nr:chromosome partitioning protein ParB [Bacillota bacterium]
MGKSRPYIANSLRLLKLPGEIKGLIEDGTLSAAHGRTLVGIEDDVIRSRVCDKVVAEGLSVRETEKL